MSLSVVSRQFGDADGNRTLLPFSSCLHSIRMKLHELTALSESSLVLSSSFLAQLSLGKFFCNGYCTDMQSIKWLGLMPKRLINEIKLSQLGNYQIWEEDSEGLPYSRHDITSDSAEYFTWLSGLRSFHFSGREGRFTARLESRANKDGTSREYWSAYRKHNKKQLRRYLGQTSNLTITVLEEAARHLADVCISQPVKVPTPRKKPIPRSVLLAQIAETDQTIEELQARVAELEAELTALRIEKARWTVQSREHQI